LKKTLIYSWIIFLLGISCSQTKENKIIGTWIASPKHNSFLNSKNEMEKSIDILHSKGINTLYICVWEEQKTAFKSEVLLENSIYKEIDDTSFLGNGYVSNTSDPVKDLIYYAHSKGMKVLFWFEYGFMSKINTIPNIDNDAILGKNPHWLAIGNDQKPSNYNSTDYYYNSFHPEVQNFMLNLVEESLNLYPEIDGIQFDDRLPAAPANSGYDLWTINQYKLENNGQIPPSNYRDSKWFKWRINKLNSFAKILTEKIKSNGDYLVSFSPNIYPWSYENLMQDWPTWIKENDVDILNVQCYRKNFKDYKKVIDQVLGYTQNILPKTKISPGIILGTSDKRMIDAENLDSILEYNKKINLNSHSFFYVKWILEDNYYDRQFLTFN